MEHLTIDCQKLAVSDIVDVARHGRPVSLGAGAMEAMQRSRAVVERIVANDEVVYGITTGFGKFADRVIPGDALERLQFNLIVSHSVGVGDPLPAETVRAMMVLRAVSLARGYSGIRPMVVQRLIDILNAGIVPLVPSKGSVGASGDLAPLAHLSLVLIGQGEAQLDGELLPGGVALARTGLEPVRLAAKEGLALINGTQLMTALAV